MIFYNIKTEKRFDKHRMTQKDKEKYNYESAGVNIEAGNEFVKKIKNVVQDTYDQNVLDGVGGFAALYSLENYKLAKPVLVSACDGVGTKIKLANELNLFEGIGQDLVAMNVNDLICTGGKPLFFLDYLSLSSLKVENHLKIIESISRACKIADVALIGGETAEMPGIYSGGDFDLAGFAVGIVDKDKKLPKNILPGDKIFGFLSSGPHSNGFSLIRKILKNISSKNSLEIKKKLLTPTKIYTKIAQNCEILKMAKGFAHITGGGISDNLPRIFHPGLTARIRLNSWEMPEILKWVIREANLGDKEALKTFNCGIGFVVIVSKDHQNQFMEICKKINEEVYLIGETLEGTDLLFEGNLLLE